jgi:methyl-accepting chemotaxis protein/cytochrome b561
MTYPRRSQLIHWTVALLVTSQLAIAVVLTQLRSLEYGQLVLELHRQLGLVILMLVVYRLVFARGEAPPRDEGSPLPGWQHAAAAVAHSLMLLLLVAQPIIGIFLAWGRGDSIGILGLVHIAPPWEMADVTRERVMAAHTVVAILLFSVCVLHIGAVIFNRIVRGVSVIDRMLPAAAPDRFTNRVPVAVQFSVAFGIVMAIAISMGVNAVATYRDFNRAVTAFDQGDVAAADQTRAAQVAWKERLGLAMAGRDADEAARVQELTELTRSSLDEATAHTAPGEVHDLFTATLAELGRLPAGADAEKLKAIDAQLQAIVDAQVFAGLQRRTENDQAAARGHDQIVLTILPMLLAGLIAALVLARSVTGSLSRLRDLIKSIEAERSDNHVAVTGDAEFAALTRDIVRMRGAVEERSRVATDQRQRFEAERARADEEQRAREAAVERQRSLDRQANRERLASDFEAQVAVIVDTVAKTAQQLTSTAGSMAGSASRTAEKSRDASAFAQETSGTAATVATGTQELSTTAQTVRENAQTSRTRARLAVEEAAAAKTQIDILLESARQIGSITDVIAAVARQTNLLAINARIEAARAGDLGRGFSVVANEVKDLAGQTGNATVSIGKQIEAVTTAAARSSQSLARLNEVVEGLEKTAAEIAQATEEQCASTRDIADRISLISTSTGSVAQNISDAQTTATATEELSAEVAGAANIMESQAEQLSEQVAHFILELRTTSAPRSAIVHDNVPLARLA